MGKPKQGKGKTALKLDQGLKKTMKGLMVKLYNWSPKKHSCSYCHNILGNGMAVMHGDDFYCNWSCSKNV